MLCVVFNRVKRRLVAQEGVTLIELLLSLALTVLLLQVTVQVLGITLTEWQIKTSRTELQQNARFAVDSIVRDLQYAKSITINGTKQLSFLSDKYTHNAPQVTYTYDTAAKPYAIRRNKNDGSGAQPVAGGSLTSPITISSCTFTSLVNNSLGKPKTIHIALTATDTNTGQQFSIETAVTANLVAP
ncbi:hypothetical protein HA075_05755 [bacterium BFN5]|nr:hypothetical protein HA075_05430 [bacterium BFN5]QJW45395.1 hypothetical protein HA075_05755 [bacterium BFN5]